MSDHDQETNEECLLRRWGDEKEKTSRLLSQQQRYQDRIRELEDEGARRAAFAVENEQCHAADLAAARGVTTRLREAMLSGATDAAQAEALIEAAHVVESHPPEWRTTTAAKAFLALHEEHKATRAELARLREQARAIGMEPAL